MSRIQKLAPDLDISTIEVNSEGLTNDIVIVNESYVFRFAKDERAQDMLAQEAKVVNLVRDLFPHLMRFQIDWAEEHFGPVLRGEIPLEAEAALIHGDIGPYHVLSATGGKSVTGVIDFGTAGLGDPACDFAAVMTHYGESFLQRMAAHYPEITSALERTRFWSGTLELQWALAAVRTQSPDWFTAHLGLARDRMPIKATR